MGNMIVDELGRIPMSPFLTATLARAADYATAQAHRDVVVEHLLLALTEDPEASIVLKSSSVDVARLNNDVSAYLGHIEERRPEGSSGAVAVSADLRRILEAAAAAAQQGRRREINGAIVLAAIVGDGKSAAAQMLRSQGLTFEEAIRALQRVAQAQAPKPAPAAAPQQASADDILASARERVQTRTAPRLQERDEEQHRPAPGPPPEPAAANPAPTVPREAADPHSGFGIGPEQRDSRPNFEDVPPAQRRDSGLGPLTMEPEQETGDFGAAGPGLEAPARIDLRQPSGPPPGSPPPGPPAARPPSPAPGAPPGGNGRRPPSWAPAPPRQPPGPAPGGPGARPGVRIPPPLPANAGPLQIPGQVSASFPSPSPGPGANFGGPPRAAPSGRGPGGAAAASRVPWPEAIDPPAPQPPPQGAQRARQAGPRAVISAGQLVHNIPPKMTVGVSLVCEARIGRAEVKAIVEGLQGGGAVVRQEVMVTKAMSVRLRSPDSGFFIEGSSPETQWIENVLGMSAEDFARWRWTITPRDKGRKRLQLIVSARTVGADGLAAETAMPDQVIEVRVRTNYGRSAKRWLGWAIAAVLGGVLARFGDIAVGAVRSLFGV
jgi:hypothetical protein